MESASSKSVLIAPLDWGLGHATRCLPIIRTLAAKGMSVIVASNGNSLIFLKETCPRLTHVSISGPDIRYPKSPRLMPVWLVFSLPKLLSWYFSDRRSAEILARRYNVTMIISDNRYGFFSKQRRCVLLTHQIHIQPPIAFSKRWPRLSGFFERLAFRFTKPLLSPFSGIWVPDYPKPPYLSGKLGHAAPVPGKVKYIGPLSRFTGRRFPSNPDNKRVEVLVIISGPEPHRTILENIVRKVLSQTKRRCFVLLGKPPFRETVSVKGNVHYYNHLGDEKMADLLHRAEVVISRPGYSTLMELAGFRKKCLVFIPTPGQTEQEYLAEYLHSRHVAHTAPQCMFDLDKCIEEAGRFEGFSRCMPVTNDFSNIFDEWLEEEGGNCCR